jgi:methionyl-tRNA synthetase
MLRADHINQLIAQFEPWKVAKQADRGIELQSFCTLQLRKFAYLALWLSPITPSLARRCFRFLRIRPTAWNQSRFGHIGKKLGTFKTLMHRVDEDQIEKLMERSASDLLPLSPPGPDSSPASIASKPVLQPTIGIDDFARLDLRIGHVLECATVEGSDKLLRFRLDAGPLGERQIFSGIRASYPDPSALVGRRVVFIANLAPRKMRFGLSEGMILSAGDDSGLFLLDADAGAAAGMPVK